MIGNPYQKYQQNSVMTASGPELTLMLYNGAIKFCNQAEIAIENKNIEKSHEYIIKAQNIILELRATLDKQYEIACQMDQLYEFILELLIEGNIKKDVQALNNAVDLIREFRDVWQQAMKLKSSMSTT